MPIDPDSYVPAYVQIADALREQIAAGDLLPGSKLPSEDRLAEEYGVAKDTVRDALAQVRSEGLVRTVRGDGTYVREQVELDAVRVEGPAKVRTRMPTPRERKELRLDEGVPVFVVDRGGKRDVLPGDRTELDIP